MEGPYGYVLMTLTTDSDYCRIKLDTLHTLHVMSNCIRTNLYDYYLGVI